MVFLRSLLQVADVLANDHQSLRIGKTLLHDISAKRLIQEKCLWLNNDAKDFRAASTDPYAENSTTPYKDYTYYHYEMCDDYDALDELSDSVGNCLPQQSGDVNYRSYGPTGYECYSRSSSRSMGCCLGDGMIADFIYYEKDLEISISEETCGYSYSYTYARVFPNSSACYDLAGNELYCGNCSKVKKDDASSGCAVGLSFMALVMISIVILH